MIAVAWLIFANRARSQQADSLRELADRLARTEERLRRPRTNAARGASCHPAATRRRPHPAAACQCTARSSTGLDRAHRELHPASPPAHRRHLRPAANTSPRESSAASPAPPDSTRSAACASALRATASAARANLPAAPTLSFARRTPRQKLAEQTRHRCARGRHRRPARLQAAHHRSRSAAALQGSPLRSLSLAAACGWSAATSTASSPARPSAADGALTLLRHLRPVPRHRHAGAALAGRRSRADVCRRRCHGRAPSLRYQSQVVTSLAFLLAFVTVGISEVTLFSLIAGVVLAASLAIIAARQYWFELTLAGIVGAYLNHFLWFQRVLPDGGQPGHPFPEFFASAALLLAYWLIFRLVYVLRVPAIAASKWSPQQRPSPTPPACSRCSSSSRRIRNGRSRPADSRLRGAHLRLHCPPQMARRLRAARQHRFDSSRRGHPLPLQRSQLVAALAARSGDAVRRRHRHAGTVFRRLGMLAGFAVTLQLLLTGLAPIFAIRQSGIDPSRHPAPHNRSPHRRRALLVQRRIRSPRLDLPPRRRNRPRPAQHRLVQRSRHGGGRPLGVCAPKPGPSSPGSPSHSS